METSTCLEWTFPLPRCTAGILIGNSVQGLMVWGDGKVCVTVARNGFWDHRGGRSFDKRHTFGAIRRLLEADDDAGMKALFAAEDQPGRPARPIQIGGGTLELTFPRGFVPTKGILHLATGALLICLRAPDGRTAEITLRQSMTSEVCWLELDELAHGPVTVKLLPTWENTQAELSTRGIKPPTTWAECKSGGFCQTLPEDLPLAAVWVGGRTTVTLATALGPDEAGAIAAARDLASHIDLARAREATEAWWSNYWADVPTVRLPDAVLQRAWYYGLFMQAGLTTPGGIAATLQGPWMEDYKVPPWSNDYHLNINLQLIYWPALATNRLSHFAPLWELVKTWLPKLRENAKQLFGVPDALMVPHAVDDRCQFIGSYWAGTLDHACTAWLALMGWLHYRYSLDRKVLEEVAWPLLEGAFNGFWAMMEEVDDGKGGKRLSLPVSVSPEYAQAGRRQWGRDSSFQLAAAHSVAKILPEAAKALGKSVDPRWERLSRELPQYCVQKATAHYNPKLKVDKIMLWEGQDLEESHRHHSHLGGIYPFCTIDPTEEHHREMLDRTLGWWASRGAGQWTGWCTVWAAMICLRCNNADAAVAWLQYWNQVYTNIGFNSVHNSDCPGFGFSNTAWEFPQGPRTVRGEIFQADGAMGFLTAITELCLQSRKGRIVVVPAWPEKWSDLDFDGIRTEGAFLLGGSVRERRVQEVRVKSLAGGRLVLEHNLGAKWTLDGKPGEGAVLDVATQPGQGLVLKRA